MCGWQQGPGQHHICAHRCCACCRQAAARSLVRPRSNAVVAKRVAVEEVLGGKGDWRVAGPRQPPMLGPCMHHAAAARPSSLPSLAQRVRWAQAQRLGDVPSGAPAAAAAAAERALQNGRPGGPWSCPPCPAAPPASWTGMGGGRGWRVEGCSSKPSRWWQVPPPLASPLPALPTFSRSAPAEKSPPSTDKSAQGCQKGSPLSLPSPIPFLSFLLSPSLPPLSPLLAPAKMRSPSPLLPPLPLSPPLGSGKKCAPPLSPVLAPAKLRSPRLELGPGPWQGPIIPLDYERMHSQ